MFPQEQTVFRLTLGKGLDGLQAFKEPLTAIGDYEVLIKVHSVAINYRDIAISRGIYPLAVKDNVVPCTDMAGEVLQVSKQVDNLSVGDAVVAAISSSTLYGTVKDQDHTLGSTQDGVLREYIVLPVHQVIKLPKSSHTLTEWSAMVATASTMWNCFYGSSPLKPGQTVLIQGMMKGVVAEIKTLIVAGTGGVALTALIFARAAGATTIITSSSDEKLAAVKAKYRPDHTINYKTHPNWAAEVQRITNGDGADHIIENGGIGTIRQSIECAAMGGSIYLHYQRASGSRAF
ncbi:hypothetical protein AYO22_00891 [Fonsecaea multimorphosa]|nr:hypothetical protein AYO22_00891 [Fonsecaea multimorphosa]